ncbi:MAG: AAA-like domain-containing protein [Deltaproteobacteria bacterium]|jgi:hypothetical protein|nr:AAA-like domain-containing protein [Deltaproteobacteria bacterium]
MSTATKSPKRFNTVGPCVPSEHYLLPVLDRLPDVEEMIEGKFYFVLHAPRQSGKTTYLDFLTDKINSEGKMYALTCFLMTTRNIDDRNDSINTIFSQLNESMRTSQVVNIRSKAESFNYLSGISDTDRKIKILLNSLCEDLDKDLVVFFDEADCLSEAGLVTFLAQIRDGYNIRHQPGNKFPRSMALVGMRDIRDYLTSVRPGSQSRGLASPFNIKKEALTLANFTQNEISDLYGQHTQATGQVFEPSAVERAWYWSEGQPWLVNALADQIVSKDLKSKPTQVITSQHFDDAAETLIKRRDTHIDSLLERLKEPRVIAVMDAVFAGIKGKVPINSDDRKYCLDLGLVTSGDSLDLRPANKIYQEVMSRVLTDQIQYVLDDNITRKKYFQVQDILMTDLLKDFQDFWCRNGQSFPKHNKNLDAIMYDEALHSLILFAYVQKALNGQAKVHREFAEGRGSVDICAIYNDKQFMVEVKIKGHQPLKMSIDKLVNYLVSARAKEGWLVIFDRDKSKNPEEKLYFRTECHNSKVINILGC